MDIVLVLGAIVILTASGLPGLLMDGRSRFAHRVCSLIMAAGAGLGLIGTLVNMVAGADVRLTVPWSVPWGQFAVGIDGISAMFLLPIFLVPGLGAIYGLKYWDPEEHAETAARLRFFYGLLAAALAMVVLARDAVLFLMAWEMMALAGFFLVTTEDDRPEVRRVGWIYLVASHAAVLCLMAVFALLRAASGAFALTAVPAGALGAGLLTVVFLLAVVGFGLKAGIMPLHVWLPGAHAMAPSHVSAVMSGVLIKLGIYGLVRITALLPTPPVGWGALLLALGVISGILGVVFAIGQHDLKRLLAYHSIENIGIIVMGLGLALIGRSTGRSDWVVLGLGGALLHVWNHALFKSLLFYSAGSVLHAAHTREIDRMGGLAKAMPMTSFGFLVGAVAICGLPPLNGFVSELLIYLGLARTLGIGGSGSWVAAAFAMPALAMIGALAVACFVKVFGAVFLGEPRTEEASKAHESPGMMLVPLVVLTGCCAFIGLLPVAVGPVLDRAVAAWMPTPAPLAKTASLAPLAAISVLGIVLAALVCAGVLALWRRMKRGAFQTVGTWDCGYVAPTSRIQYTSSSFAQMLVGLFSWVLRPRTHRPRIEGPFPSPTRFESHVEDTVLEGALLPTFRGAEWVLMQLRFLQQGHVQLYILYILIVLLFLLVWLLLAGTGTWFLGR